MVFGLFIKTYVLVCRSEPIKEKATETIASNHRNREEVTSSKQTTHSVKADKTTQIEKNAKPETTTQIINTAEPVYTESDTKPQSTTTKKVQQAENIETKAGEEEAEETDKNTIIIDGIKYKAQPNTFITYYCPCDQCSEGFGRSTSSGATATAGRTVAMPSNIPFGTKIYYNGHVYICEDRGGAIGSSHIDMFCNTHGECYQHSDSGTYQTIYIEVR